MPRQQFVIGAGLAVAATALAACSTYGKKLDATATTTTAAWATDSSAPAQPAADAVAKTSDVPVGSGVIVGEIIVTANPTSIC